MERQENFSGTLQDQDWMVAAETVKVMKALNAEAGEARFVGGCVRDALANRKVVDIDIATPLIPEKVIERLDAHKIPHAPTGLKHGTVTAIVDGKPFEITTLRVDVVPYGRQADVAFTDNWKLDAARRDFTINAMSATINGEIFDPFGGIRDLREGRVVFVGDPEKRIKEDVLRILRFFRFNAHFGRGAPDPAGLAACSAQASLLPRLSAERVRQETLKLLDAPRAADIWETMLESGVAGIFLPEATNVAALRRLVALEKAWHDGAYPLRRLAALLAVTEEGLGQVCTALRLSNEYAKHLHDMCFPGVTVTDAAGARRLVYTHGAGMAHNILMLAAASAEGRVGEVKPLYDVATAFRPPRFPVQGADVLKLGVPKGPEVGRLLKEVESWWLDEDFKPGRTACLEELKKLAASASA